MKFIIIGIVLFLVVAVAYGCWYFEDYDFYKIAMNSDQWTLQCPVTWRLSDLPQTKFSDFKKIYEASPKNWFFDYGRAIEATNRKQVKNVRDYSALEISPSFVFSYPDWRKYRKFVKEPSWNEGLYV